MPARPFKDGGGGAAAGRAPTSGALLALVIDADRKAWTSRASQLQDGVRFVDVLDDLLIYINAFLLLSGANRLVVVAAHRRSTRVLYPPPESLDEAVRAAEAAAKKAGDSGGAASAPSAAARPELNKVAEELGQVSRDPPLSRLGLPGPCLLLVSTLLTQRVFAGDLGQGIRTLGQLEEDEEDGAAATSAASGTDEEPS